MSETAHQSYLTVEAYDRLTAELAQLSGPGRVEIAKRIEAARLEGDLRENGGYHAADAAAGGTVEMFGEEEVFLLGHREIKDGVDMHVFSERSPLGAAVNGKRVGDSVSYVAPNGKTIEVTIVHTTPYTE